MHEYHVSLVQGGGRAGSQLTLVPRWKTEDPLVPSAFLPKPARPALESLTTESECLGIGPQEGPRSQSTNSSFLPRA